MTITAILLAAILAGLGSLNVYLSSVSGGPTSSSNSASATSISAPPAPSPYEVYGGGPVT